MDVLNKKQKKELKDWESKMLLTFISAMILIVLTLFMGLLDHGLVILAPLIIYGGFLQFSQRCPNCNTRVGYQTRLILPDACQKCGAKFRK